MELPDTTFCAVAYVAAAILITISMAVMRGSFRVGGAPSWIIIALLGPLPVLAGIPLAGAVALNTEAALPAVGISVVLGLIWIHVILPAITPDYSPGSFGASCLPAALMGVAVLMGGAASNCFPQGYLMGNETAVFQGRSADALGGDDLSNVLRAQAQRDAEKKAAKAKQ